MATDDEVERIVAHAKKVQDDERYGQFSNPVVLGLLLAVDIIEHPKRR